MAFDNSPPSKENVMKRLALVAAVLAVTACSKEEAPADTAAAMAPAPAPAAAPTDSAMKADSAMKHDSAAMKKDSPAAAKKP
jgi:hypothetical protein